ncbi:uncharacterized protein [Nicotiana sylvestris]|uniref:uncharacterized protein n=1 Tax=Nicotiana sylvestris TaxID=4096 RepID=UPI00388C5314
METRPFSSHEMCLQRIQVRRETGYRSQRLGYTFIIAICSLQKLKCLSDFLTLKRLSKFLFTFSIRFLPSFKIVYFPEVIQVCFSESQAHQYHATSLVSLAPALIEVKKGSPVH